VKQARSRRGLEVTASVRVVLPERRERFLERFLMVTRHGANGSAFGGADGSHKIGRRVGAIGGLQCESTDHFGVIRRRRSPKWAADPRPEQTRRRGGKY